MKYSSRALIFTSTTKCSCFHVAPSDNVWAPLLQHGEVHQECCLQDAILFNCACSRWEFAESKRPIRRTANGSVVRSFDPVLADLARAHAYDGGSSRRGHHSWLGIRVAGPLVRS